MLLCGPSAELNQKEKELQQRLDEDFLTPIRESLEGEWRVDYDSFGYDPKGNIEKVEYEMIGIFSISNRKKLFLTYKWRHHPIWPDGELTIEHIALSPQPEPEKIIWFDEPSIPKRDGTGNVSGRIFSALVLVYEGGNPVKLSGSWFDLDGAFTGYQHEYWKRRLEDQRLRGDLPKTGTIVFERRL